MAENTEQQLSDSLLKALDGEVRFNERALADLAEFSHWVRTLGSYRSWKA